MCVCVCVCPSPVAQVSTAPLIQSDFCFSQSHDFCSARNLRSSTTGQQHTTKTHCPANVGVFFPLSITHTHTHTKTRGLDTGDPDTIAGLLAALGEMDSQVKLLLAPVGFRSQANPDLLVDRTMFISATVLSCVCVCVCVCQVQQVNPPRPGQSFISQSDFQRGPAFPPPWDSHLPIKQGLYEQ